MGSKRRYLLGDASGIKSKTCIARCRAHISKVEAKEINNGPFTGIIYLLA